MSNNTKKYHGEIIGYLDKISEEICNAAIEKRNLKFLLSQANDKVSELTALSAKGGLLLMENIDKRSQLEEKLESSVSLLRQCQYELRYAGNAGIGKKYSIGTLIFKTLEFLKTIGKDQIG